MLYGLQFLKGAKAGVSWGRHIGKIQNGLHPVWCRSQFKNLHGYNNKWQHILGVLRVGEADSNVISTVSGQNYL